MTKEYFDIIIIAPLDEEAAEVFNHFRSLEDRSGQDFLSFTIDLETDGLTGLLVQLPEWGKNSAYQTTRTVLDRYDAGLVVCLGIAGRISTDLKVGDVCYTGTVIDVYERQKITDAKGRGRAVEIALSPIHLHTPRVLTNAINYFRPHHPTLKEGFASWQESCQAALKNLLSNDRALRFDEKVFREKPVVKNGAIACAAVSASENYNSILKDADRKILAIETESGGVFQAAAEVMQVAALTIRGISDFADSKKNALEEKFKDAGRLLAAHNAAAFLKAQFSNSHFLRFLAERRQLRFGGKPADLFGAIVVVRDVVESALESLGTEIDAKLRELCPEFRVQQKGYRLPIPRIAPVRPKDDPRFEPNKQFYELHEALAIHRLVLVAVPRNYPDHSLPWVFADDLLTATIGDQQAVPFVIDGEDIRPPNSSIANIVSQYDLQALQDAGTQLVFIVPNITLTSRTRQDALLKELEKYPAAKFIFVSRGEGRILLENEFIQELAAEPFSLCNVSFLSIRDFLSRSFEMPMGEAEVVALQLRRAFDRFKLSAHPSYFAGIPKQAISALLQANRRSELIQLAVDGFLTYVVADDDADVTLSRTTRKVFLGLLAVEIDVRKTRFSQSELVDFTNRFAEKYDFDIDALQFINSFVEKGILRFEDDRVEFTLPFIRSYLLAVALADDENLAKRHFGLGLENFDSEAFDLYCEIRPSKKIVAEVVSRLKASVQALQSELTGPEILLTDQIRPALLKKLDQIEKLRDGLQSTIKKLYESDADGEKKQRLLDIADRVNRDAGKRAIPANGKKRNTTSKYRPQIQDWLIATILLGAGAEHLEAPEKQELASLLVSLANLIIDALTRERAKVNFVELKKQSLYSDETDALLQTFEEKDREDIRAQIGYLIDFAEMAFLAQPFRTVLHHLCEQARNKVLAKSVEKSKSNKLMPSIIRSTWLTDLDIKKGLSGLRKNLSNVKRNPFFRVVFANHLVNRVYWSKSKKVERDAMLKLATDTIKPLGKILDDRSMERKIGKPKKRG